MPDFSGAAFAGIMVAVLTVGVPVPLSAQFGTALPEVSALADAVTAFGLEETAIFANPATSAHVKRACGIGPYTSPVAPPCSKTNVMLEFPVGVLSAPRGTSSLNYSVRVPYLVRQSRPLSWAFGIFANGVLRTDEAAEERVSYSEVVVAGSLAKTTRPHFLFPLIGEITGGLSYGYRRVLQGGEGVPNEGGFGAGVIISDVVLPNFFVGAAVADAENIFLGDKPSEWRAGVSWRPLFGFEAYDISVSADYIHPASAPPASFGEGLRIGLANESNLFLSHLGASSQIRVGFRFVDTDKGHPDNPLELVASVGSELNLPHFRIGFSFSGIEATPAAADELGSEPKWMVYGGFTFDSDADRTRARRRGRR